MMQQTPLKSLTRRYATMLVVLAALIAGSFASVVSLVQRQAELPEQADIAGRQRMLSQRIVALALWGRLVQQNPSLTAVERSRLLDSLGTDIDSARLLLKQSHQALRHGRPAIGFPALPAEFQPALTRVEVPLAAADSLSRDIIAVFRADRVELLGEDRLDMLVTERVAIFKEMDGITLALNVRGQRQLELVKWLALASGVILLLIMALMSRYVFRPASRAIESLVALRDDAHEQLVRQTDLLRASTDELEAQNAGLISQQDELECQAEEMARLTAISDASPDPIVAFHIDGRIIYANRAARGLTAMTKNAADLRTAMHILDQSCRERMRTEAIPTTLRDGLWRGDMLLALDDGTKRPVHQTLVAHHWPDGSVAYISSVMQDLTAMHAIQAELAAREARYRTVVSSLAEGVILQDEAGTIVAWNPSAEQILGLSGDQLSGRTSYDSGWEARSEFDEAMSGNAHPIVRARVEGVEISGFVTQVRRGDGSRRWLSVNARPIPGTEPGKGRMAVATFSDITERRQSEEQRRALTLAVEQSDHAVLLTNAKREIVWVNASWESLTGYALSEAIGRFPPDLLHGAHTSEETSAALRARVDGGETWNGELLAYRRDGSPVWVELSVSPTRDASGQVSGTVSVSRDITARREAVRERQRLAAAVALTADGIAIVGATGTFEFVNHAYARMHHVRADNLLGSPWQRLYALDESERLALAISPAVADVGVWQGETTGWRADSSQFPQALSVTQLPTGGLVFVVRDISERVEQEERVRQLSLRDELTGLYNRRGFLAMADHALRTAKRNSAPCTLLFGDMDRFKHINDTHGHDVGDEALREVADLLRDTFRDTDLVARLGGDEFTVLATNATVNDLSALLSRLDEQLARSNAERAAQTAGPHYVLGLTIGSATVDDCHRVSLDELLREADQDLYERKRARRAG